MGYAVTGKLSDVWSLEPHKLGDTTLTHFGDGTAHKNRMQGNDFVTSAMYTHGVTCFTCHDAHGTDHPSNLRKPAQDPCLDCHGPGSPNGPHADSLEIPNVCNICHSDRSTAWAPDALKSWSERSPWRMAQ